MISYKEIERLFDVNTDFESVEVEKFLPIEELSKLQKTLRDDYSRDNVPYDKGLGRYSVGHDLSSLECIEIAAKRVTEILKQTEFNPSPVEEQVASIFAMNAGYFDHVEVKKVKETQKAMIEFVKNHDSDILESFKKDWSDESKEKLIQALEIFKKSNQ